MAFRKIQEAADELNVSVKTVRRLIDAGELVSMRAGVSGNGPHRIPEGSITDYIQRHMPPPRARERRAS